MKKLSLLILSLLAAAVMTGCQSPGRNPAGVYGSTGLDDIYGIGGIPLAAGRFTGGMEYPGMFTSVLFAYDSSQVSASERPKIEAVAQHLKNNSAHSVIIEGHCDERGSREYNLALGERRALAVRSYLVGLGIEADRIQTKSMGEESPVDPGHNEASWRLNRRGEFILYY